VIAWTLVLLWPGRAPLWLLICLVLALAVNGPTSAIGFDFARTSNPSGRLGVATGLVNVGGFTASLCTIALVGVGLDLAGHWVAGAGAAAELDRFRLAMATQYLFWALGAYQVRRYRARTRRELAQGDPERFAQLRAGVATAPS